MKKVFSLIVALALMVTVILSIPFTVNAATPSGFVVVRREFHIDAKYFKSGVTSVSLNPRLFWYFQGAQWPFKFELAKIELKKKDGSLIETYGQNTTQGFRIRNANAVAAGCVVQDAKTGIDTVNKGFEQGVPEFDIWTNSDVKQVVTGDYIVEVTVKLSDVDQSELTDQMKANPCRINLWSPDMLGDPANPANPLMINPANINPVDPKLSEKPVSLEEWMIGTDAYNAKNAPTATPGSNKTTQPSATDKNNAGKPITADSSMAYLVIAAAAAAFGGLKLRKSK